VSGRWRSVDVVAIGLMVGKTRTPAVSGRQVGWANKRGSESITPLSSPLYSGPAGGLVSVPRLPPASHLQEIELTKQKLSVSDHEI
jgi:hypothetical protein